MRTRREKMIMIRLNDAEAEKIEKLAKSQRLPVSTYLRNLALDIADLHDQASPDNAFLAPCTSEYANAILAATEAT